MKKHFINLSISEGALDCWVSSYTGKKNRLGNNINILCNENEKDKFINLIIKETSSLGVRANLVERYEAKRKIEKFKSSFGYIQVKLKYFEGQLHSVKPEFDDLRSISELKGSSIYNITNIINKEINDKYFNLNWFYSFFSFIEFLIITYNYIIASVAQLARADDL